MPKKLEMERVFILKNFKVAMDGIGAVINICKEGTVTEIPKYLVSKYENLGKVSTDEEYLELVDTDEEADVDTDEEPDVDTDEEQDDIVKDFSYFMDNHTRKELIALVESQMDEDDEPLTSKQKKDKGALANLCVVLFEEEEESSDEPAAE